MLVATIPASVKLQKVFQINFDEYILLSAKNYGKSRHNGSYFIKKKDRLTSSRSFASGLEPY